MELKQAGQIVLIKFPNTDLTEGKLRPAVIVTKVKNDFKDWLTCMISAKENQFIEGFDEEISHDSLDFNTSGLKKESIIRISRLAIVEENLLIGKIGEISTDRLKRIKTKLSNWILSD